MAKTQASDLDAVPFCYGRYHGHLEGCQDCGARIWCEESTRCESTASHAPPGRAAGATGDDAAFEYALANQTATVRAIEEDREARAQAAKALLAILAHTDGNPDRIRLFVQRINGMSLEEAGRRARKTKQAAHKDIAACSAGDPEIARVLRLRHPQRRPAKHDINAMLALAAERAIAHRPNIRRTGPAGLYAKIARAFDLPSANSVRCRLQRLLATVDIEQHAIAETPQQPPERLTGAP
jgi:hypothetical protein